MLYTRLYCGEISNVFRIAAKNYWTSTHVLYCAVPKKKTYSPHRRNWNLLGWGFYETKKLKKCMKLNWNFQRGGEVLEKIPSVGEVWIFSVLHIITFFEKLMYKCSSELPI